MPLFLLREVGLSKAVIGGLVAVNATLIVLLEVPITGATAAWPLARSLSLGAGLVGLGFGALALAHGVVSVIATIVVWTFGEMLLSPATFAAVATLSPQGRTGEAIGLHSTAFGLAMLIGPWLGVTMLERYGSTA